MNGRFLIKLAIILVLLGGATFFTYRYFFGTDPEKLLRFSAAAYREGEELYKNRKFDEAAKKFDEAHQFARKAITAIEHSSRLDDDKRKALEGDAGYLHALSARDAYYSQASAVEGSPLGEAIDQATGKTFRNFHKIKDPIARQQALTFLRNAATQKPHDKELVQDALRAELMAVNKDWTMIHRLATFSQQNSLKPDDKQAGQEDARALYLLARIEYEQPDLRNVIPPLSTRSRDRMERALPLVRKLKELPDAPLWRTLHLEAKILEWFVVHEWSKDKTKTETQRREKLDELHRLLLTPGTGAVSRARKGEGIDESKPLHSWDVEGVLGILLMAVETQMEKIRVDRDNAEPLVSVFQECLAVAKNLETRRYAGMPMFSWDQINSTVIGLLNRSQKMLGHEHGSIWKTGLTWVRPRIDQSLRDKNLDPGQISALCEMLLREAWVAGKQGKRGDQETIHEDVYRILQESIQVGRSLQRSNYDLLPVLMLKAEIGFGAIADPSLLKKADKKTVREEFLADLQSLRATYFPGGDEKKPAPVPYAQALSHLLAGGLDERDGKLEQARIELQTAMSFKVDGLIEPRAHAVLANVQLALGKPESALDSLRKLERIYLRFDDLSYAEKQWMSHFIRGKEDLDLLLVICQLEFAEGKLRRESEQRQGQRVSFDLVRQQENDVQAIIDSLPIQNRQGMQARQVRVQYLLRTNRLDAAEQELALLQKNYPDSLELLQTDLELLAHRIMRQYKFKLTAEASKAFQDQGDAKVRQFMQDNPGHRLAKLFHVTWLARSQRAKEAMEYLHDPKNFPETNDDDYRQIEALVHITLGQRQQAESVLRHLPQSPRMDAIRALLVTQFDVRSRKVKEALSRYEEQALFRIIKGQNELQSEHYAEAADTYFQTLDYTRVKPHAQAGLQSALFALAQQDPLETRKRIEKYMETQPKEPTLYLGYAVACLYLGNVGARWDETWDQAKSMISALNAWEIYTIDQYATTVPLLLTRAEFFVRSNQPQLAYQEAKRAVNLQPKDVAARTMLITLCLEENSQDRRREARANLQALRAQNAELPILPLLEAQAEITEGNPRRAVEILELARSKFPAKSTENYVRAILEKLVEVYEKDKKFERAAEVAGEWRRRFPDDLAGMMAELRQAIRTKDPRIVKELEEATMKQLMDRAHALSKKLQDYDEAHLRERRKAFLDNREVHYQVEICRQYLRADRLNTAETKLENLRTLHPTNTNVLYLLGQTHQAKEDFLRAAEFYERVLQINKYEQTVAANLAWIRLKKQLDAGRAFEILDAARRVRHSDAYIEPDRLPDDFLDTLGYVYRERGKLDRRMYANMKGIFEKVLKRYPIDPRMRVHLAYALLGMGGLDEQAAYYLREADELLKNEDMSWLTPLQLRSIVQEIEDGRKRIQTPES
jgi:predicted Zn-dependent protease